MTHKYRKTSKFTRRVPVEVAAAELERIWEAHDRKLTPAAVVEDARPETALLHEAFEWDDALAGEQYRLWQARQLIKAVRIVESDKPEGPQFIHVKVERPEEPAQYYQHATVLSTRPFELQAALLAAFRKLKEAETAYGEVMRLQQEASGDDLDISKVTAILTALATARTVAQHLQ
jgi:hypothetical protein